MQLRTVAVVAALLLLLGGAGIFGIATSGGTLEETWVSDTPRDNERNHHPVGVGPNDTAIVAPIAEVPVSGESLPPEACSLVRLDPTAGTTEWRVTVPPDRCFTHALTQPAIDDLDGDGRLEVVVASTENAVVVYDAAEGTEEWRVDIPTYGYGRPAIADLLEAPGKEIVASDINGNVAAIRANGTTAWKTSLEGRVWDRVSVYASPRVDDFDGDGRQDVLVGSGDGVAALDPDGEIRWHRNETATYIATERLSDEAPPTVFTSGYDGIRAYDGSDGELKWERDLSNARIESTATIRDRRVIFAGVYGGDVVALDATTGEEVWTTSIVDDDVTVPPPVVADVTGDGTPEVIAVANDGTVAVLAAPSGSELAAYERTVPIWTAATPGDIDSDGRAEILVTYGDGRVVALEYRSSPLDGVFSSSSNSR